MIEATKPKVNCQAKNKEIGHLLKVKATQKLRKKKSLLRSQINFYYLILGLVSIPTVKLRMTNFF